MNSTYRAAFSPDPPGTVGYVQASTWEVGEPSRARAIQMDSDEVRERLETYSDFYHRTWKAFTNACLAGDIEQIEHLCDRRVLELLRPNPAPQAARSLQDWLGPGWKVERVQYLKLELGPLHPRSAISARATVDLTENGQTHRETFCWVLRGDGWKCLNLPFATRFMPVEIKSPPTGRD